MDGLLATSEVPAVEDEDLSLACQVGDWADRLQDTVFHEDSVRKMPQNVLLPEGRKSTGLENSSNVGMMRSA